MGEVKFVLDNIYNSYPLVLKAERIIDNKKEEIAFPLKAILSKRRKKELSEDQLRVFQEYLNNQPKKFIDDYWNMLKVTYETIETLYIQDNDYMVRKRIKELLSHFDIDDIREFLLKKGYAPPSSIKRVYDLEAERNGLFTREQTFIKEEYLDLMAVSVVLKSILGPIGKLSDIKSESYGDYLEYNIYSRLSTHPLFKSRYFTKYNNFVSKSAGGLKNSTDEKVRNIKTITSSENMISWFRAIGVINVLLPSSLLDDNEQRNLVTKVFKIVKERLRVGSTANINDKSISNTSNGKDDEESLLESYRANSEHFLALSEELKVITTDFDKMTKFIGSEIDEEALANARSFLESYKDRRVRFSTAQLAIIGWVCYKIIDPRGIRHLNLQSILNLLAVTYSWLMKNNFEYLALLVTATMIIDNDDSMIMMGAVKKSRLLVENKEKILELYKNSNNLFENNNSNEDNNVVLKTLNSLTKEFFSSNFRFSADEETIERITGSKNRLQILDKDLINKIAELIIYINK